MKTFGLTIIACLCLLPVGCVEKEKLYGTWAVDSGPAKMPKGTEWQFTESGKVKLGMEGRWVELGTYTISGSIISISFYPPNPIKEGKARILTLTDDKLILRDDAETQDLILYKRK